MLSEFRKRKLAALFSAFDGDRDGVLTNADPAVILGRLSQLAGLEPGSMPHTNFELAFMAYWKDFVMTSDANADGRVTIEEWNAYHEVMLADDRRYSQTAAMSAGVMFALVDKDHDGYISLVEYGGWLRAWQVDAAAVTDELLAKLDIGEDGRLSQAQVLDLTREFFYSDDPDAPGNWAMGPF